MKKFLVVMLILLLLAMCGAGGYFWYQHTHFFIEEAVYEKDADYLDLRGTDISLDHYHQLRQQLPNADIVWDIPFQGGRVANTKKQITITELAPEDIEMFSYFIRLQKIDALECNSYDLLKKLAQTYPDIEVTYFIDLGGMKHDPSTVELTLEEGTYAFETMMENLIHLPDLQKMNLPRTTLSLSQLEQLRTAFPDVELSYTVSFRGQEVAPGITELDLSDLAADEVADTAAALSYFPDLTTVELMNNGTSALSLVDVQTLQEAAPQATFHYTYSFYGKTLSTTDTYVEYSYKYMKDSDEEEIRQILDVMDNCESFIFNGCHISDEIMAQIREDYRGRIQIAWRVYFGNVSCLTNKEVIKCVYGLTDANSKALKYCEDARFIDFGHNETLTDISFIAYMPKLEAIILSGSMIRDLTPFEGNTSLYFLELANCTYVEDLTPLKSCTNLGMLNLSYTAVTDLSPVDELPLERFTFVRTDVSDAEIARYKELNPDCWVVCEGPQPYGIGWRAEKDGSFSEYYLMLASKEIFNYPL